MALQNVVTGEQLTKVTELIEKVVEGIINFFYSFIDVVVSAITKPAVLSGLAVLFIMFWAYRKFTWKVWGGVL